MFGFSSVAETKGAGPIFCFRGIKVRIMSNLIARLQELFESAVRAQNCELWGIEYVGQGRHSILRVYIDADAGVTVDDCAAVSHQLSGILDVNDGLIPGEYTLEVSSPGMDRPLFLPEQYRTYIGEIISVRLFQSALGRRKITGVLVDAGMYDITITENGYDLTVPYDRILRSHVVPRFE